MPEALGYGIAKAERREVLADLGAENKRLRTSLEILSKENLALRKIDRAALDWEYLADLANKHVMKLRAENRLLRAENKRLSGSVIQRSEESPE